MFQNVPSTIRMYADDFGPRWSLAPRRGPWRDIIEPPASKADAAIAYRLWRLRLRAGEWDCSTSAVAEVQARRLRGM